MSFVTTLHAVTEHAVELPFPPIVFGMIAIIIFIFLGVVTFTYRDVSNRHVHKAAPGATHHAGAPGADTHGSGH